MEDKIQTVYDEKDINNLFKILPSEIILQNFDKEKPIEEIISIENLSNNELDINISISNQKNLNVNKSTMKLSKNEKSDITVKLIPPINLSEDDLYVSFKFLNLERRIKIKDVNSYELKARNKSVELPNELELNNNISDSSSKTLISNQNIKKNDKVFSEYSCKLLNNSLINSLKPEQKNVETNEIGKVLIEGEFKTKIDNIDNSNSIINSKISTNEEQNIQKLNKHILTLNQENKSLKDRYDRMITKMKLMEEIIKEYQTIIWQNSLFKNLKIEETILFSIIPNIRIEKKGNFPCLKGENIYDLSNSSNINDNVELSQVLMKQKCFNQSESLWKKKGNEDLIKQINNEMNTEFKSLKKNNDLYSLSNNLYITDITEKNKGNLHTNSFDYLNLNNNSVKINRNFPSQENIKPIFKKKLNAEDLNKEPCTKQKCEIQNAIELSIYSETQTIIDLKKIDDELIVRLRERFLELQFFSFNENKKRIESLLQIQDSFLLIIFDIKEKYTKHIQTLQEENNTNQLKIMMEEDFINKTPFREFSEKSFFINTLHKLEEQIKLFMNKASSSCSDELLQEHLYIQTTNQLNTQENLQDKTKLLDELWNELQNMDLISNELYNFKVENKRLIFENKSLLGEISNLNQIVDELKQRNTTYEQEYSEVEKELNIKDEIINEKDNIIIQLEKEIEDLKINIVDPESQNEMINKYEEKINLMGTQLNQNQLYLQQLNEYCEDYKSSIGNLYKKLSLKDNEILELKSQLVIKDKIMLNLKKTMNNSSLSTEKNINFKENEMPLSINSFKDSKELKEKDSTIEEYKLMNNKLQCELKRIQINEKNIITNYKFLSLENENLLRIISEMKNSSQTNYYDRRKLLKIDHVLLNKIFLFFSDLLTEIYSAIGKRIPNYDFIENEGTVSHNIENNSKIMKDYINNIIAIFKSNSYEILENSLKVNSEKIKEFFQIIIQGI